jgi:hypothetical protein
MCCLYSISYGKGLKSYVIFYEILVYFQAMFSFQICEGDEFGNHPKRDLTKFGYMPQRQVENISL